MSIQGFTQNLGYSLFADISAKSIYRILPHSLTSYHTVNKQIKNRFLSFKYDVNSIHLTVVQRYSS